MILTNKLTEEQVMEVSNLMAYCKTVDGAISCIQMCTHLNFNREMNCWFLVYEVSSKTEVVVNKLQEQEDQQVSQLIGVGAIFAPSSLEAELSMAVHPDFRRQGIATQIQKAAQEEILYWKVPEFLLVWDNQSLTGKSYVQEQKAQLHHTEYTLKYDAQGRQKNSMALDCLVQDDCTSKENSSTQKEAVPLIIREATQEDVLVITDICVSAFGGIHEETRRYTQANMDNPMRQSYVGIYRGVVCSCVVGTEPDQTSINGVAVLKTLQGQGIGRAFLEQVLQKLLKNYSEIWIDVDNSNASAYHLYKKLGFVETSIIHYESIELGV